MRLGSKGQSITEYALVIALIGTILVGLELYMRPRVQTVIKVASDQLGNQEDARMIDLEDGEIQGSEFTTVSDSVQKTLTSHGGGKTFEVIKEITSRTGWSQSVRE